MRIGKYQITKIPKFKAVTRKLPLDFFFEFPNGIKIYTYRDSDLPLISGRYYDQVKNDLQFLTEYGITKEVVKKYDEAMMNLVLEGVNRTGRQTGEIFADQKKLMDEKESLFKFNGNLHMELWWNLVCMFFVLDGEEECHFSPAENQRKRDLISGLPEVEQERFFFFLESKLQYYRDGLSADIISYIQTEAQRATEIKQGNLGDSLNTLIEMMPSLSRQPDGQE